MVSWFHGTKKLTPKGHIMRQADDWLLSLLSVHSWATFATGRGMCRVGTNSAYPGLDGLGFRVSGLGVASCFLICCCFSNIVPANMKHSSNAMVYLYNARITRAKSVSPSIPTTETH